jgi:hypothetical protein
MSEKEEECCKKEFPGAIEMLGNLANTAKNFVQKPTFATEEQQAERLDICNACDHFVEGRCQLCGCVMKIKVKVANIHCPDNPPKWTEV